jgi:hypothetical protein
MTALPLYSPLIKTGRKIYLPRILPVLERQVVDSWLRYSKVQRLQEHLRVREHQPPTRVVLDSTCLRNKYSYCKTIFLHISSMLFHSN